MMALAILLGSAGVAYGAARLVRADALPFLLVAGFVLSLLPLPLEEELVRNAALVGLAFLVFLAGHELNPHRVAPLGSVAVLATLGRVAGVGVVGGALAMVVGVPLAGALVVGLAAGSCSPTIGVRLLEERREFFEPAGRLAAGVMLLQGLVVILALPLLRYPAEGLGATLAGTMGAAALMIASLAFMRWLSLYAVTHLELNEEVILLVIFSVLAVFIGLAYQIGLPVLAGAFLAGIALSRFPVNGIIRGYLKSTSDLATAIAFTALGALIAVPRGTGLVLALLLIVVVVVLPPALLALVGRADGLTTRPAFRGGVLVAQTSEFSIVLTLQAVAAGILADDVLGVILLVTGVTMVLTPILSKDQRVWNLVTTLGPWRSGRPLDASDHILILGLHGTDLPLLAALRHAGQDLVVVDDDPALVAGLKANGIPSLCADATAAGILAAACATRARAAVVTLRPFPAAERALSGLKGTTAIVRVRTTQEAERVEELGAVPVLWATPIAEDFLEWADRAR
jgi:monovalent cation:H+ antiporter-2, CPA2 family